MPIHIISFQGGPPAQAPLSFHPLPPVLIAVGPVVSVLVEVPSALAAALQSAGSSIPQPASGLALIDTGATRSAVDDGVIQALGVQPTGVVNVGTAAGMQQQSVYSARFTFPGSKLPTIEFAQLTGVNLRGHVVPHVNVPLIALIGRDLLSRFIMVYNGPHATVTLAY